MDVILLTGHQSPVLISSIVWLEGDSSYTRVHYQNGSFSVVTQSLSWFEQHLNFIRVHRSAIVNPGYIQGFSQKRGRMGWITLSTGKVILVSRNRLELTAMRILPLKIDAA